MKIVLGKYIHKTSGKIVTVVGHIPFRTNQEWVNLVAYKTSTGRLCVRTKEEFNEWFVKNIHIHNWEIIYLGNNEDLSTFYLIDSKYPQDTLRQCKICKKIEKLVYYQSSIEKIGRINTHVLHHTWIPLEK